MVKNFTAEEIIQYISDAKKATPIKVYINGEFSDVQFPDQFKVTAALLGSFLVSEAPRWRARGHPGACTDCPGREVDTWVACCGLRPLGGGPGGTLGPILQVHGKMWTPG
ncbi:hypothetical protein [Lacticaseibacillus paracasei]|uniref:hypothetical protein n=1 Tax=Lacticaseibacillus paracasei TaxID=1597 RepID=UPI00235DE150|nr:hypothetical protein [Lacticaseibacillus paracasei]